MRRCPSCREYLSGKRDEIGARCPWCREPLYETPFTPDPMPEDAAPTESSCALHPQNLMTDTCDRCGNFLCDVCVTRWGRRRVCPACIDRALAARTTSSPEVKSHFQQALLSLLFGMGAWVFTLVAFIMVGVSAAGGTVENAVLGLAGLMILGSPIFSLIGVGQGAAAIRTRGNHLIMATCGLLLSGLQVGVVIGMFGLAMWNN